MTTVFEHRGFMTRQTLSAAVMVVVFFYGWWELLRPDAGQTGLIFGAIFIGGGLWALNQVLTDTRDQIAKLEVAENGETVVTLWRVTGPKRLVTDQPLDEWRYYVKIAGRGLRRPFLFLRHPGHPRELQLELQPGKEISDGLRELAPHAIAEHEDNTGGPKATD